MIAVTNWSPLIAGIVVILAGCVIFWQAQFLSKAFGASWARTFGRLGEAFRRRTDRGTLRFTAVMFWFGGLFFIAAGFFTHPNS